MSRFSTFAMLLRMPISTLIGSFLIILTAGWALATVALSNMEIRILLDNNALYPPVHWANQSIRVVAPDENEISFADGALVQDISDHKTVYMINAGVKRGFVSPVVFSGFGYKFSQVTTGDVSNSATGQPISFVDAPHPEGALVKNGATIYKISNGGKQLVPDINVFNSWRWQTSRTVAANAADLALPDLNPVKFRDGALFKAKAGTIYIASHGRLKFFAAADREGLPSRPTALVAGFVAGLTVLPSAPDGKQGAVLGTTSLFPDGTLLQATADYKIYYLANGMKRWILSPEAFRSHGFRWQDVVAVSAEELNRYPESEAITEQSQIVLPGEIGVLPDLTPFPVKDLRLESINDRTVLRFSSIFWNQGHGKFELVTDPEMRSVMRDGYLETLQRIVSSNGTSRDKSVGNFLWHDAHKHYHYSDFADYTLELVQAADPLSFHAPAGITQKTTFCMRDNVAIAPDLPGAPRKKVFTRCQNDRQGVSIGWADVYAYTLPEQFIDVTDMPPGLYRFSFLVDPRQRFVEGRQDNNVSIAILELDVHAGVARVIASGMPFANAENHYPNGMLIQGLGRTEVYVMHNNKKFLLGTKQVLERLGFLADTVYELPLSVMDVIPQATLVRVAGRDEIYVLNEAGFKRHILNPQIFNSYGWDPLDIATINSAQLSDYPETDLIMRVQDGNIYSITNKHYVGKLNSLSTLGLNPNSLHMVNEIDFNAYDFLY